MLYGETPKLQWLNTVEVTASEYEYEYEYEVQVGFGHAAFHAVSDSGIQLPSTLWITYWLLTACSLRCDTHPFTHALLMRTDLTKCKGIGEYLSGLIAVSSQNLYTIG